MKALRHRDGQPESVTLRHGLRFHIDRHDGTVMDGVGPDGPYHVVQKHDYGYVAGFAEDALPNPPKGDDGEGWDATLGPEPESPLVFVVTNRNVYNGAYDEQKGYFGFGTKADVEAHHGAHYHPKMFGRIGQLTLDAFRAQLSAHRAAGGETFRAETDEDLAELKQMQALETELGLDEEPFSTPSGPDADDSDDD